MFRQVPCCNVFYLLWLYLRAQEDEASKTTSSTAMSPKTDDPRTPSKITLKQENIF